MKKKIVAIVAILLFFLGSVQAVKAESVIEEYEESIILTRLLNPLKENEYWEANLLDADLYSKEYFKVEHYEEITQAVYEDALKFKYDIATEIDDGRIQMYFKQRNKDELITKEEVICNIRLASNGIGGINHWNTILLNRLDMTDYEEIINAVEEDGKELYQISEIIISEDKESFSLLLETNVYCVIKGDTLWQIAQRKRTTVDKLVELNQITYPDLIYPNKYLKIK